MRIRIRFARRIHASLGPRSRLAQLSPIIMRLRRATDPVSSSKIRNISSLDINVALGLQTQ
jgi:hypothetical protein